MAHERGLAALINSSRCGWVNGHYGAAMIATYFFAREVQLEQQCDERALALVGSLLG